MRKAHDEFQPHPYCGHRRNLRPHPHARNARGGLLSNKRVGTWLDSRSTVAYVYGCRFLTPDNEMCNQAWTSNSQALYDWNEVNIDLPRVTTRR